MGGGTHQITLINCRQRVAEVNDRELALGRAQSNESIADRAAQLNAKADPSAARLATLTAGWLSPEQVSNELPTALSSVAELTALFGPLVLARALATGKEAS